MAIVQISQIKNRRGTSENLPQLASAELGWSIDTRKLYIGNGTLEEGAPEIGNTEILTQYSTIAGVTKFSQSISNDSTANITDLQFTSADPSVIVTYSARRDHTDGINVNVRTGTLTITQYLSRNNYIDNYSEIGNVGMAFAVTQVNNVCIVSVTTSNIAPNNYCNLTYTINSIEL